jgi:ribosome-associated toxin RatA of RatAB toxin-antitoxin module
MKPGMRVAGPSRNRSQTTRLNRSRAVASDHFREQGQTTGRAPYQAHHAYAVAVADQTSASINIAAKPDAVMAVISDVEHYPDWIDSMKSAEVLTSVAGKPKTVRMVLDHTLVKDNYVLAYDWKPRAVSWRLIEGNLLKAMDGAYVLKPNGAGTTVTYMLSVDINMPMISMFKRKAEKTIIDSALKGLKKRVEG